MLLPILTLAVGMLASLALLVLVRRTVGYERLAASNDVASAFFTTVGTIYAVILAFMVFAVWTDFQEGEQLCDLEANEIVTVARLSDGLSADVGGELRSGLLSYARTVVDDEWQRMDEGGESGPANAVLKSMWPILMKVEPRSEQQKIVLDHALTHLEALRQLRRSRLQRSHEDLPPILWSVLGFGGWVTVVCACLFGVARGWIHAFQTALLAALLMFVLYAIGEIKHPFQGRVHVEPTAFRVAIAQMQAEPADPH